MKANNPWRTQTLRLWLASLVLLVTSGCGSISVGPLRYTPQAPSHDPALHADPGVRVTREGVGELAYEPGMTIRIGDIIETGDGFAVLDMGEDNIVALRKRTRIQLGSIKLFFGEVFSRISQLTRRGGGQVLTNELSASVEGTEYAVRRKMSNKRGQADTSLVIVRRGTVRCYPASGATWTPVELTENLMLQADGTRVGKPQEVDAQSETRWADEAEKRLLPERQPGFSFGPTGTHSPAPRPTPGASSTSPHPAPTAPSPPSAPAPAPSSAPASAPSDTATPWLKRYRDPLYPAPPPLVK